MENRQEGRRGFYTMNETKVKTAADIKAEGVCPWSGCGCARAPRCIMAATEACVHLVRSRVVGCKECREANGTCEDAFLCFLDVRDAERRVIF